MNMQPKPDFEDQPWELLCTDWKKKKEKEKEKLLSAGFSGRFSFLLFLSIKYMFAGLQRWLSTSEHQLLFRGLCFQSPLPHRSSQTIPGSDDPFWFPQASDAHVVHWNTCSQDTRAHNKIKWIHLQPVEYFHPSKGNVRLDIKRMMPTETRQRERRPFLPSSFERLDTAKHDQTSKFFKLSEPINLLLSKAQIPLQSQSGSSLWAQRVAVHIHECHSLHQDQIHKVRLYMEFVLEKFIVDKLTSPVKNWSQAEDSS